MSSEVTLISEFLAGLKLSEYVANFLGKGIVQVNDTYQVDDDFLQEIGITKVGHRKRILMELSRYVLDGNNTPENLVDIKPELDNSDGSFDDGKENSRLCGSEEEDPQNPSLLIDLGPNLSTGVSSDNTEEELSKANQGKAPAVPVRHSSSDLINFEEELNNGPREGIGNERTGSTTSQEEAPPLPPKKAQTIDSRPKLPRPTPPVRVNSSKSNLTTSRSFREQTGGSPTKKPPIPPRIDIEVQPCSDLGNTATQPITAARTDTLINVSDEVDSTASRKEQDNRSEGNDDSAFKTKESSFEEEKGSEQKNVENTAPTQQVETQIENTEGQNSMVRSFSETSSVKHRIKPQRPPRPSSCLMKPTSPTKKSAEEKQPALPVTPVTDLQNDEDSESDESEGTLDYFEVDLPAGCKVISMRRNKALFDDTVAAEKASEGKRASRASLIIPRSGYLYKRGGEKGTGGFQKRWIEFDTKELRYYRLTDRDAKGQLGRAVPVYRMQDVEIVRGAKKPQFNLKTSNRTYIFSHDDQNEIINWGQVLMQAILLESQSVSDLGSRVEGGAFANPDLEGSIKKQGHNVLGDWKLRYVVIKDSKVAYYYSYEDYAQDMPIGIIDMAITTVKEGSSGKNRLNLVTPKKEFWFEFESSQQLETWKTALDSAKEVALGDKEALDQIRQNPSNCICADCGAKGPVWASTNLGVVVCKHCIGWHRHLGARISKSRSICMDKLSDDLVELFQVLGNENANKLWECKLPPDEKIHATTSDEGRLEFIAAKYNEKRYFGWSPLYGQPNELGKALQEAVVTDNVMETLRLIVSGVNVWFTVEGSEDQRTPYELAKDAKQNLQMQLLQQFGGNLEAKEREDFVCTSVSSAQSEQSSPSRRSTFLSSSLGSSVTSPVTSSIPDIVEPIPIAWEKEGYLLKRGPRNARNEVWKERKFFLKDKNLWYDRGGKEQDREVIDLRKMVSVELGQNENDPTTINISLSTNRVYYIKAHSVSEAEEWYNAIRNKQVIGVPIEVQEANANHVPYLVMKCIDYIESYGLQQKGVYRHNGSQVTIKKLQTLFNQDARNVHLTIEDYPIVHDITGVLKSYLKRLPEPVIESAFYEEFTRNISESDHEKKLETFKALINRLSEVSRCTLRALVLHLVKIAHNSEENFMKTRNIVTIFGPLLMSNSNTVDHECLAKEFEVLQNMLLHYDWLFDVSYEDTEKDLQIEEAKKRIMEAEGQKQKMSVAAVVNELNYPVYVNSLEDCIMVLINSKSSAADVCWDVINLKALSFEANWALFEMFDDHEIERPLQSRELIFPLVMEGKKGYTLMLKPNYVAEMTGPYQKSTLGLTGHLHIKKNDSSWKKNQYLQIETGNLIVYNKKGGSEQEKLAIHEIMLFIGIEKKKKPPGRYGITIRLGQEMRYLSTDNEASMNEWVAVLLQVRYPMGVWSNVRAQEQTAPEGNQQVCPSPVNNYWGRQSTFLRPPGASLQIRKEIQSRLSRLKSPR